MIFQIPAEFCLNNAHLSWSDVRWGYRKGFISWRGVVSLATHVHSDLVDELFELAHVHKDTVWKISESLEKLAEIENYPEAISAEKWLFLCLAWLYENQISYPDPLGVIEEVYADFGYPQEISSFVRFLPPSNGRDPRRSTLEDNKEIIVGNWLSYLNHARERFRNMS